MLKEEIEVFQHGLGVACERQRKVKHDSWASDWTTLEWPLSKEKEAVERRHWSPCQTC